MEPESSEILEAKAARLQRVARDERRSFEELYDRFSGVLSCTAHRVLPFSASAIGEGRARFARRHPPSKPAVFTEVKQPGKVEDSVREAFEYGFRAGVPFVVLTDGRKWSFYLPAEQGSYGDLRIYKLDLYECPSIGVRNHMIHFNGEYSYSRIQTQREELDGTPK